MPTDQATNEPQITSIEDWNKPREASKEVGVVTELPSGRFVRLRRTMDMMTLLQSGKIPNPLASIVNKMIQSGQMNFGQAAQESEDPEAIRQLFEMINQTMVKTFMEPKVSAPDPRTSEEDWEEFMTRVEGWSPEPGTLSVFDIELPDKMFAFAFAQGAATDLARFRDESESAMGVVQPSKPTVKPTKRTGGARSKK